MNILAAPSHWELVHHKDEHNPAFCLTLYLLCGSRLESLRVKMRVLCRPLPPTDRVNNAIVRSALWLGFVGEISFFRFPFLFFRLCFFLWFRLAERRVCWALRTGLRSGLEDTHVRRSRLEYEIQVGFSTWIMQTVCRVRRRRCNTCRVKGRRICLLWRSSFALKTLVLILRFCRWLFLFCCIFSFTVWFV